MKRLLIANRGEIALRIARAAKAEHLTTLGVFSEDDMGAPHTRQMDALIPLSGSGSEAYLDIAQIVDKAVAADVDAVHPGYGFLSENAAFGRAVEAAGMTFIGPTPEVLAQLGDKLQALELAKSCGVPVLALADKVLDIPKIKAWMKSGMAGDQILIKALSGGGGRGIRVVSNPDELDAIAARAASEAKSAFGQSDLYAERYLENARHVEVQIIGDGSGAVSHLWDRDCSLQRRHQKLLEIAPSPNLSDDVRNRLCEAAKSMAEAVNYRGVGTFEFLVDAKTHSFYFIEANARLQVEHTVTEAVLGIDLVKAQLAIAYGQSLADSGLQQDDIPPPNGTAVQARILLESLRPGGMVIPSDGELTAYDPPTEKGIRVDDCGHVGYRPNPAFDSLVAKVVAYEPNGDLSAALAHLSKALDDFELDGAASNLDFQQNLISDPRVDRYDVSTQFIDANLDDFLASPVSDASLDPLAVLSTPDAFGATGLSDAPTHIGDQPPLAAGLTSVDAPMPGKLVSLTVEIGDEVAAGRTVAI
ncbi:MAG: biotin carboxylase N-terminal domain-containing protein, partial [Pseudomonadota bacterium]